MAVLFPVFWLAEMNGDNFGLANQNRSQNEFNIWVGTDQGIFPLCQTLETAWLWDFSHQKNWVGTDFDYFFSDLPLCGKFYANDVQ